MSSPIIIIGSGLAGYHFAREFRALDTTTPLMMISQDGGAFYPKPQLSTALAMNKTAEQLMAMSAEKMAETLNMTIVTHTTVTAIDAQQQSVWCGEQQYDYHSLILATGANTPLPPLTGDSIDNVLQVNDVYQYQHFRQAIEGKQHLALMGAGLVGCEFANDLTKAGFKVTIIDLASSALSQLLPPAVGQELQTALTAQGVEWRLGHAAISINKKDRQFELKLDNDELITADIVFSAIGLKPNTALATQAGLSIDKGITVDATLKTSHDHIYALGDCANVCGFNLPYIAPILQCAKALAKTLSGEPTQVQYPAMPVVIKTSCYPLVVCCHASSRDWQIESTDQGIKALMKNDQDELVGFILSKGLLKERMALQQQMKALF